MRKSTVPLAALLIAAGMLAACSHHIDLTRPSTQDNVGVEMARMNLWREAMFRFHRAVQIDPNDAMAHNNLAVALEANGDFEGAAKEYREALRLDRANTYIQKNYSRFTEFMARSKKRPKGAPAAATAATTTSAGRGVAPASSAGTPPAAAASDTSEAVPSSDAATPPSSPTAAPPASTAPPAPAPAGPPAAPSIPQPAPPSTPPSSTPQPPPPVPHPPGGVV